MRIKTETVVGIFIIVAVAVFLYMGLQIRAWRLDAYQYNPYTICFHDVSGLSQQADVQIAGVSVGWVDDIRLVSSGQHVEVNVMVLRQYVLHANAYGIIRQDGMLGTKFLEIVPGDAQMPAIEPGSTLMQPDQRPYAVDDMIQQVGEVVSQVRDISKTFQETLAQETNTQQLSKTVETLHETAQYMSSFMQRLDDLVSGNHDNISQTVERLHAISGTLQNDIPNMIQQAHTSLDRLTSTLDTDMRRITDNVAQTSESLDHVMHKIDSGDGVVGQLISDPALSDDMRTAVESARSYFDAMNRLAVIVDGHSESMTGSGILSCGENAKGHINLRMHFVDDYFYLAGIAAIQGNGDAFIKDEEKIRTYFDENHQLIRTDELDLDDKSRLRFAPFKREVERKFDYLTYNLQVGKMYDWLAIRTGLFESAFGVAADINIPLNYDNTRRWISSLEVYDWNGRNRVTGHHFTNCERGVQDDRPHLKWINKLFVTDNFYVTVGADDFISKTNKNAFIGAGLRFADDNLKYLISQVSF